MPGYKTHLVGGVVSFGLVVFIAGFLSASFSTLFEWLCCACLGALFPDIDIKSKGQQLFFRVTAVVFVVLLWQRRITDVAIMSTIALIPLTVKHRGITHSMWFIGALCAMIFTIVACTAASYLTMVFFDLLFFFAGAFSHVLLDFGPRKLFFRK
ncbi:MAG TPA: metal-dependent hydrolase [Candidatus Babeliales bacterium]|nr:metal-dependent hydrolase [Candidatus Babeliales bacterium]